jgi:hypothetical protein
MITTIKILYANERGIPYLAKVGGHEPLTPVISNVGRALN